MPAVPVKFEVGLEGVVTVPPAPLWILHAPVPFVGVFAAKVVLVTPHRLVWSAPAAAVVGVALTDITTSSVEAVHGELEIVHLRVAVPGFDNPVTPDVGEDGVVIVALPDTTDQAPVPAVGVLPARVVVLLAHIS